MTQTLDLWRPDTGDAAWLAAGVTTRAGGTSTGPYASLNLGLSTGDDPERVRANRAQLASALGLRTVVHLSQIHGTRIWQVPDPAAREGDGLWTETPGVALAIGVADCVPVFVWDVRRRRVALLHAGWRGTAQGILGVGLDAWIASGAAAGDLRVALGPSIGPCCYTVSEDVATQFPTACTVRRDGRTQLDLRTANRLQAVSRGVVVDATAFDPPCTGCTPERFYSHRMQGPHTGRMWALAWIRPEAHQV